MQRTYQIKAENLNAQFLEIVKQNFGNKELKVTIEEIETPAKRSQTDTFKKLEKLRKKLNSVRIDPNVDLSALANKMADSSL